MRVTERACDAGCEAIGEVYTVIAAGFGRLPGTHTFADQWLAANVLHGELPLPVVGEIEQGAVAVELDKATFAANTKVRVLTAEGKHVIGTTLSTAVIPFRMPVDAAVHVKEAGKRETASGLLVAAKGLYTADDGILVAEGTDAVIVVRGRAVRGQISEQIRIARNRLGLPPVERKLSFPARTQAAPIDKWSSAGILCREIAVPVRGEIVEGTAVVELDKASFRAGTEVSAIVAGGKNVRGITVSTSAIGFRVPIQGIVEATEAGRPKSVGGLLLQSEGTYRKGEGIVIPAGADTIVLAGGKVVRGKNPEELRIGTKHLRIASDIRGFRRLTQ